MKEKNDLGILFQDVLKFNKHISNKVQNANSMLGLIIRSFDYLDKDSCIRLYKIKLDLNLNIKMLCGTPN